MQITALSLFKKILRYSSFIFAILIGFGLSGVAINFLFRISNVGPAAYSQNQNTKDQTKVYLTEGLGKFKKTIIVPKNLDDCLLKSINEYESKLREYCADNDCSLNLKEIKSLEKYNNSDECYKKYPE